MKTVLIPVDFSDVTPRQMGIAAELLPLAPCRIQLLHVHDPAVRLTTLTGIATDKQHRADELEALTALTESFRSAICTRGGIEVVSCLETGPAAEVVRHWIETTPDLFLVIMGTHGHGRLFNLLVGSTAEQLLRQSHVPVLFVPSPQAVESETPS